MAHNVDMGTQAGTLLEQEPTNWRSVGLSLLIHVVLLVALGLIWTTRQAGGGDEGPRPVAIVLASANEEPEYFDQQDLMEETVQADTAPSMQQALPDEAPPVDTARVVAEVPPIEMPLPGFNSTEMARVTPGNTDTRNIRLTPEQQKMLAAESAAFDARRPRGPATSISVFGSGQMTGRKFVFVIDRSKSMGGQGLNVLDGAASELAGAINSLEEFHQFQIVAYHHKTVAIGTLSLLDATDENKSEVSNFIANLAAFGGTEHEAALTVALSMGPDVVVLLTDGGLPELNESQLARIRRAADGAQIHCIQFGSGPAQNPNTFMRKLAGQNVGTYRYIDVSNWSR